MIALIISLILLGPYSLIQYYVENIEDIHPKRPFKKPILLITAQDSASAISRIQLKYSETEKDLLQRTID